MFTWMLLEYYSSYAHVQLSEMSLVRGNEERQRNVITSKDVQRALMFLFFSVVSFFGTGNIASLNSFDPKSIQTLVSVFNPFLMGSLLLMKVLIPFLAVACFVCVVCFFIIMFLMCSFFTSSVRKTGIHPNMKTVPDLNKCLKKSNYHFYSISAHNDF